MVRRPDTSHTLLFTVDRLGCPEELLAVCIPQQLHLFENQVGLLIPHAYRFCPPVDVVTCDDGMSAWSGGDGELDLGVCGGKAGEQRFDKAT